MSSSGIPTTQERTSATPATRQGVDVTIEGQTYTIRSDLAPVDVRRLAQYVDELMVEIRKRAPAMAPSRVAILAALNLAEELFRSRERSAQLAKRVGGLVEWMDRMSVPEVRSSIEVTPTD